MPIGSSALSAECSQVRKICCALSAECTPELRVMSTIHNAVVHCVWSWVEVGGTRGSVEARSAELAGRSPPFLVGTGTVEQVFTEAEANSLQLRRGTDVR